MTTALSIIYVLMMFVFVIIFFVAWYRSRKQVSRYKTFGFSMGAILVGLELVTIILMLAAGVRVPLPFVLITDTIAFFRTAAFTIMGIHYCTMIGLASFPLLMQKYGEPQIDNRAFNYQADEMIESNLEPYIAEIKAEGISSEPALLKIELKQYFTATMAVVVGGVIFSSVLFLITTPQLSDLAKQRFGINSADASANEISFLTIAVVLTFAFVEELMFRLGIQNFLANKFNWLGDKYWLAILITTALWTIGHVGVLDPNWVKLVQVFPVGVALGWLCKKYGVESSIMAHAMFNVIMLFPSQYLLSY